MTKSELKSRIQTIQGYLNTSYERPLTQGELDVVSHNIFYIANELACRLDN